jgi:hypothetical protein
MWKPNEHSDDDNLRWALLRAIEWQQWPLFLAQPIIPVLLYVYPWPWVIGVIAALTLVWRVTVAARYTPSSAIDTATYFVLLRFVSSPVMAYLIWEKGHSWIAGIALFWPWAGNFIVNCVLMIPEAVLQAAQIGKGAEIGVIQRRLMNRFGYVRHDEDAAA